MTQSSDPMMVRIVEEPHDPTGLAEILIGSVGLTGAIFAAAVVLGTVLAGVMFWIRRRHAGVIDSPQLSPPSTRSGTSESR